MNLNIYRWMENFVTLLPEAVIKVLVRLFANLATFFLVTRRKIMYQNMRIVFGENLPESRMHQMEYRSWYNLIYLGFETFRFPVHGKKYLSEMHIYNYDAIRTSMDKGRGLILLAPHTGNFLMGASFLAQDYPVSVMIRPSRNKKFQEVMQQCLDSMGFESIDRVGGVNQAVRALRNKRILVIALDQHASGHGVWVNFFGKEASTYRTPATLALRYNCPVILGCLNRNEDGCHEGWVGNALELIRTGDAEKDILLNTEMFNREIEKAILSVPETWMWMHKRWKKKPENTI